MTRLRTTIAVLFIVAFAAGATVALALRKPPPHEPRGSWLGRELELTADQREQMAQIWSEVGRDGWQQDAERRRELQRARDQALRDLVPAERREEFDKVSESYSQGMTELSKERRAAFERAVEKTKAMLTPPQRARYEEMLARRPEGGRWRSGGRDRPQTAPATRPAED